VKIALRFLSALLRRDVAAPPGVAQFFLEHSISPQPTIRTSAQLYVALHDFFPE
jgi:proteasome activator subunit 4